MHWLANMHVEIRPAVSPTRNKSLVEIDDGGAVAKDRFPGIVGRALNGEHPARHSKRISPTAYRSEGSPSPLSIRPACSGER